MPQTHRCLLLAASLALIPAACGGSTTLQPGPDAGPGDPNVVRITSGLIKGSSTDSMRSFKGIPYAAPPVGKLRWAPPAAAIAIDGTLDATKLGAHCPQPASPFGVASTTEDCLFLNVYSPTDFGLHPVMVWIHGGALFLGQSDEYDPTPLVNQGIVVVTINYRLGALGFMAHPALTAEDKAAADKALTDAKKPIDPAYLGYSGNYGLMDQQAALKWVQSNIYHFGGDNTKVTIFGESAGGLSVHSQLVMTDAAKLFSRAIAESGAYAVSSLAQPTVAAASAEGVDMAVRAGCPADGCTVEKLRDLKVEDILAAQAFGLGGRAKTTWLPVADGKVIPTAGISASYVAGKYAKVPLIEGSNHDEYRLFVGLNEIQPDGSHVALTADGYQAAVASTFPQLGAAAVTALTAGAGPYNPANGHFGDNNVSLAFAALGTDVLFACNSRAAARTLSSTEGAAKVYVYEFNDPNAPQLFLPPAVGFSSYGAYHASEIQYLFTLPNSTLSDESKALSDKMVTYWTNFAKTGDPNLATVGGTPDKALPQWPVYATNTGSFADLILTLAPGTDAMRTTTTFAAEHNCETLRIQ